MRRVIKANDHKFIKNGRRVSCTAIHVPFNEIPEDCNFSEYETHVINVLCDDCYIRVKDVDVNQNSIIISIPKCIRELLFISHKDGLQSTIKILQKLGYEEEYIKNKQKIPYNNTII